MPPTQPHRIGIGLAAGGMVLISLDSLGIRLAGATAWDATFWFGVFAFAGMLIVVRLRTGRSLFSVVRDGGIPMLVSGLLQATMTTFFILALGSTTVAHTVVILAAAPAIAALIARATIGERTATRTWSTIVASLGGIVLVVWDSLGAGTLDGDAMALVAVLAFSGNIILLRRHRELNRLAVVGLGGFTMAVAAAFSAHPLDVEPRALAILALIGGLTGQAGRTAVATATRFIPAAQVALFVPVETVAAITWAWLFLDETPSPTALVGGAIVIGAVLYGASRSAKTSPQT